MTGSEINTMDIEIYAICCSHDLKTISSSSLETAPYLSDAEGKALLNQTVAETRSMTLCTHNAIELPSAYKGKSVSLGDQNTFHLFSYHDLRSTANIKGCYVVIASENMKALSPKEQYKLSQNILMKGRNLYDIIKKPVLYTKQPFYPINEEEKHIHKYSNGIEAPIEPLSDTIPPFNACNLCTIS